MSAPPRPLQGLLQFSAVVAVSGVMWMLLLDSLHAIQEHSERTVMESAIHNMNSGLQFEIAARIMRGEEASLPLLVGNNPMNYLEKAPSEYVGVCTGELLPGAWCFDAGSREIVYLPRQHRKLTFPSGDHRELRWRIISAAELSGTKVPAGGPVGAITLASSTSFK